MRRKRRDRMGHAVARLALKVMDVVASVMRSHDPVCASGARVASHSHNSLFKIIKCQILGDAIAWGMRSREWAVYGVRRGRVGHAVA